MKVAGFHPEPCSSLYYDQTIHCMYFVRIFRLAVIEAQRQEGLTIVSYLGISIKVSWQGKEAAAAKSKFAVFCFSYIVAGPLKVR